METASPLWGRVAGLRLRLTPHARIHRHYYRGQVWYVVQDEAGGRLHRFNAAAHRLIGLMDGSRTLQELWDAAAAELGDDCPTQDEVIRLLASLHAAGLMSPIIRPSRRTAMIGFQRGIFSGRSSMQLCSSASTRGCSPESI